MRLALIDFAAMTLLLLAVTWAGHATLPVLMGLLFAANAFLGLVMPPTFVLALEAHGAIAGLASWLSGTFQMVTGGLLVTLLGSFFDSTPLPMVAAIALCAVLAVVIGLAVMRRMAVPASAMAAGK